jgi:hypothetical protein
MDPQSPADLTQAAAAAVAAARLVQLRLTGLFPALLSYVAFLALLNASLGLQKRDSSSYFYTYVSLEAVKCAVGIMAVREPFALIFDKYPGLRTAGRWAMYVGVTAAAGISLLTTIWTGGAHGSKDLFYFEVSERWVTCTLALVIVAILWFISRYPLHLGRNTLFSCAFFSAIFLSDAFRLLLDSLAPRLHSSYVDLSESAFECICLISWAVLLRRPDDKALPPPAPPSAREEHLLGQLEALNELMTHVSRR